MEPRGAFVTPPFLRAGSLVAIVAPASPFDREEAFRGLAWLRSRYRLAVDERIFQRAGYLAGDDAVRADVLARAMRAPEVEAIVCARGGYGAMRVIDDLPWDAFARQPKHLVGFSDVTALHGEALARGVASIHAPNVTGLGRAITASERYALLAALEGLPLPAWRGLVPLAPGKEGTYAAEGPVVGGNLALVTALVAAGRFTVPAGAILVLEDVTERPYRIDRMLTSLLLGGHLARASAIVFGDFTQCEPGADGITVSDVLRDRTASCGIPVVTGGPFGHGAPNHAFPLGRRARLAVDGQRLDWLEGFGRG